MSLRITTMALRQHRTLLTKPPRAVNFSSTLSTYTPTTIPSPLPPTGNAIAPLAAVPITSLLRSLFLYSVTASPRTCSLGTKLLVANLEKLNRKGVVKWAVDRTFYTQFCAGPTAREVATTISGLRSLGFAGVILAYARETEMSNEAVTTNSQSQQAKEWLEGTLKTISYVEPGDYVAIKYSGMGLSSLPLLNGHKPCFEIPELGGALKAVCDAAEAKGVRLLIDAEQASVQDGVHRWTLNLMRQYNTGGKAVVYNTYQMYLKSSPEILCRHLEIAHKENFTLGVKLVRGAYLHSDPRHLIHDSKEDTDKAYDDTIKLLLTGSPGGEAASFFDKPMANHLRNGKSKADLVVASHNKDSVFKALTLRRELGADQTGVGEMTYAQLMGMADELSLGLLAGMQQKEEVKVFKYAVWGTTQECVKYLVRRAEENKEAVARSADSRRACMEEVWRRVAFPMA